MPEKEAVHQARRIGRALGADGTYTDQISYGNVASTLCNAKLSGQITGVIYGNNQISCGNVSLAGTSLRRNSERGRVLYSSNRDIRTQEIHALTVKWP